MRKVAYLDSDQKLVKTEASSKSKDFHVERGNDRFACRFRQSLYIDLFLFGSFEKNVLSM